MNSLAYALLSMLVRTPLTGYELNRFLDIFWQANHSQIYPLLNKLEGEGYLIHEKIEQTSKPSKKIYSITDAGKAVLTEWLSLPPAKPIDRDEFLIKTYAIWLTDKELATNLFQERITYYEKRIQDRLETMAEMEKKYGDELLHFHSPHFGRYTIYKRRIQHDETEIDWCYWVLSILEKQEKTTKV